jgi:hypothetical protein
MPNGNVFEAVKPTLFLGLGGTGKEILLRLRRKFFTHYGNPGFPCIKYLWLDTDIRDVTAQGEKMDEIYREVSFGPQEKLALLEGDVGTHMADVFQNRDAYKHIHPWLYKDVEAAGRNIADGAGNVRAVGRLAYFFHYHELEPKLRDVLGDQGLKRASVQQEMMEILPEAEFDPRTQAVVVASVAGGTGSGTLLDSAFTLAHVAGDVGLDRIVLLLLLPNVYFGTPGEQERPLRSYGNSYAALKELEFYCVRLDKMAQGAQNERGLTSDFEVTWTVGSPLRIVGPPFHLAYLLEVRNEQGIGLDRTDVFDMAAEVLFLDFLPGEFSRSKRSRLSNDVADISGHAGHNFELEGMALTQAFSRRWASFGMAKIEIPVDQVREACAAELAYGVVKHWDRPMSEPDVRGRVLEEAAARRFDAEGIKERFGPAWKDKIRTEIQREFKPLPEAARTAEEHDRRAEYVAGLREKIREFRKLMTETQTVDPALLGIPIAMVRNQARDVWAKFRADLQEWIADCVDNPARGFNALIQENGFLPQLSSQLQGLWRRADERARTECENRAQKAAGDDQAWERRCLECVDELEGVLSSRAISGLAAKNQTARTVYGRILDTLEQSIRAATEREIWSQASEIARLATEFLGREREDLSALQRKFPAWAANYAQRRDNFLDTGASRLYIRIFERTRDWPLYYCLGWDEQARQGRPVNIRNEETAFLTSLTGTPKAYRLLDTFRMRGEETIERELVAYAVRRFRDDFRGHPRQQNVLRSDAYQNSPHHYIQTMVNNGLPMVMLETALRARPVAPDRHVIIGVEDKNEPNCRAFAEAVAKLLMGRGYRETDIQVLSTGRPWEAYLFVGTTAFPLPAVKLVTSTCHESYYKFYRSLSGGRFQMESNKIPLHFSRHVEGQLDDLVVYTDEDVKKIKEALEILVFGRILRVIECSADERGEEFGYQRWIPPATDYVPLGLRRDAIEALRSDHGLRRQLRDAVKNREMGLTHQQRFSYYWLLSYLRVSRRYLRGTSEANLLTERVGNLQRDLADRGIKVKLTVQQGGQPVEREVEVTRSLLDLSVVAPEDRPQKIRTEYGAGIDWTAEFPLLAMEPWVVE